MRQAAPLNNIRILAEPGISATDLGALIRTTSLSGCNSFFQLYNPEYEGELKRTFDPLVIRGSAGLIFTLPVYYNGTIRQSLKSFAKISNWDQNFDL